MKTVEYLPNPTKTAKSVAALKDLEQAWAYYVPEPQPQAQETNPTAGYVPYYDAA